MSKTELDPSAKILEKIRAARSLTVSPEELRAAITKALVEYHALDPELKEMVSGGEDEIIQATIAAHTIKAVPFTEPRAATRAEEEKLDRDIFIKSVLGDDAFAERPANITESQMAAFRAGGNKLVSPLQQIIDREVEKVLAARGVNVPFAKSANEPATPSAEKSVASMDPKVAERLVDAASHHVLVNGKEANLPLVNFILGAAIEDRGRMREAAHAIAAADLESEASWTTSA